ncbi:hypothetical protein [Pediococcus acidilactici]|uniref:hypothetical protein n=1 Tax=Pediococcus acidilactici TaxID=1254 RepID=UPI002AFFEA6B|nr:hypothetical protein [Pediococcus acidilactici]WQS10748.1 hypothetical protein SGW13_08460 [Pediococcus acidilactici]
MQVEPNVVITEFIINMDNVYHDYDNTNLDVSERVKEQAQSLDEHDVPFYVLTNSPDQVVDKDKFHIVNIELFQHYSGISIFFYRLLMAYDFLQAHPEFDNIQDDTLYMGDEWGLLGDTWIINTNNSPYFIKKFIAEHQMLPTVNMGLIIGTRAILLEFLGIILKLITESSLKIQQGDESAALGKYDMEIGNYVAYRYFADRLVHGREVSTILQGFQSTSSAWFKHK